MTRVRKRGLLERGLFRTVHFLEILLELRDSKDSSSGKTPFVMTPFPVPTDENGENDEFAFYPLKTRASLLRPPRTTKMMKMAGVTQANAWFRKSQVCSSLIL